MFLRFADNRDHQGAVYALAASADGQCVYSGSGDGFVVRRDPLTLETQDTIHVGEAVFALWEDQVHRRLWIGTQSGSIRIVDLMKREEIKHIIQHTQGIFRFKPNRELTKLYALGGDGMLSLWLLNEMQPERLIPMGCGKLRDLCLLPDGLHLAVACKDGSIRILETDMHREVSHYQVGDAAATSLFIHPSKPVLLSGHADGRIHVWRLFEDDQPMMSIDAHQGGIYRLAQQDDMLVSCSRDKTIKCWSLQQLNALTRLEASSNGHRHSVNDILPLKNSIISAGDDRQIIVWQRG